MISKKLVTVLMIVSVILFVGCESSKSALSETPKPPNAEHEFTVSVLKVGQADAIILRTLNHCVIIDCGEKDDGDEITEYLKNNNVEFVDYLFITHFDKDHIGGAAEVIDNTNIGKIITPDYDGTNDEYDKYKKAAAKKSIKPTALTENMSFILDDVLFEVYPPLKKSYEESDNDFSLAIGITHGDNTFLFAGDAETERLSEIMSQTDKTYDFLKIPHHGRYSANTKAFVNAVKPTYAVITCSKKSPAEDETIAVLDDIGCKTYYTKDGNVNITSDGHTITITQ